MNKFLLGIVIFLSWSPAWPHAGDVIEHRLRVTISPEAGTLAVTDEMTLPETLAGKTFRFRLHPALTIRKTGGGQLTTDRPGLHTVKLADGTQHLTLEYHGRIRHALSDISDAAGKTQHSTRGWIGEEGVFLSAASAWYPLIDGHLLRFDLQVEMPAGWQAISQGEPISGQANHWRENHPQEDIYLVAGRYQRYASDVGQPRAMVYLRQPDGALAKRYLEATRRYIALYDELLGDYPYAKFALVENFWESGYGMPSFTLLGPTVIRLPFIIHTSYPHEILHNWFGNGVYVDWARGNWSEGLTTYLADHLLREQRGSDAAYRRDTLKTWADHVHDSKDFPLQDFRGRHGDASQAIGYGKAMMFFHMVRKRIGDEAFFAGLQRFYRQQRFKPASYADLRHSWEQASGTDLKHFFDQWLTRTGAPRLALDNVHITQDSGRHRITATLRQTQQEPPYPLRVPIRISFANGDRPAIRMIDMTQRQHRINLAFAAKPLKIEVDPEYDCFRQLYPEESPLTLSAVFGSDDVTIVLPADAPKKQLDRYLALAEKWRAKRPAQWRITTDTQLSAAPQQGALILLGWENRFTNALFSQHPELINDDNSLSIDGQAVDRKPDSLAMTLRLNQRPALFIATENAAAIDGLARKLPHYGKYSLLLFSGTAPEIRHKQQWATKASPLSQQFP